MNIVFVTNAMGKGGAERVIANLTSYLSKENKISIVSIHNTYVAYELDENVKLYTLDTEYTDIYSLQNIKSSVFNKIKIYINRIKKMNQYKKQLNPDIVVSFMPLPSFLVLMSNKIKKIPTIVSVRNNPQKEFASKKNKLLMKWLFPSADGFVFQTKDAKEFFNEKIQNKCEIIPNPINPIFIEPSYQGEREKIIVSVGRLEEQKNQKLLIEAFSKISDKYKDYNLVIYGEGKLRQNLQKLIEELNLQNRVSLPGNVDNIKEKIYKATMFVLSSNYEGMPNSLMEAMALGLPVISTDCPCGGPKFLIENNVNGILIKNGDIDELTEAMEKIINDEDNAKKMGINANKISEDLNPDKINKKWKQYIEEVLNKSRKRRK